MNFDKPPVLNVEAASTETTQVGGKIYSNHLLLKLADTIPIQEVPLSRVSEAVGPRHSYWIDANGAILAPHTLLQDWKAAENNPAWADHVASIKRADLSNPIWITRDGHVFDGVHRLSRAVLENKATILVRVFDELPKSALAKDI